MRFSAAFAALAVASAQVQGQATNNTFKSAKDINVNPQSVGLNVRGKYLLAIDPGQTNSCNTLCGGETSENNCKEADLSYDCICTSNHSEPGLEYYTQTMPYYKCQYALSDCISANAGNAQGQDACNNNIKPLCPKNDPPKSLVSSGKDDGSSSTTGASQPSKTSGGSAEVTSTSSRAFAGPTLAPMGNGVFVAAMGLMAYLL
ncbi:PCI domain-containing protein [Metarhizium album ARSEF 1941]|uniref:PCI domain-containing protein n=1 Tax=Metarhizium album (strain ARSEF 1941) TaxID=1081103 RepID=A0A0B2WKK2_METAS|nr:PCI domain-containing protein [Metarhizium album ARSEF 1941]KHN94463.1 PCI domain-containing protein [Metarhizium album ARSEF 1941]